MFNKKKIKELKEKVEELECKVDILEEKTVDIKRENKKDSAGMTLAGNGSVYIGCLPNKEVSIQEALQLVVNYLDIRHRDSDEPKLIKKGKKK